MRSTVLSITAAGSLIFGSIAHAAAPKAPQDGMRAPEALAYTTAANLGLVATMLAKNHQDVKALIAARSEAIVARERVVAAAQNSVARELDIYDMSRGTALADSLRSLMRQGDRAAGEREGIASMEAGLRDALAEETAMPAMSNAKLNAAAKKLASLAERPSAQERAAEAFSFFKETKKAVEKLDEEAKQAKDKSDEAMKNLPGASAN